MGHRHDDRNTKHEPTLARVIGELCDTLGEGDGIDPREIAKRQRRERRRQRSSSPRFRKRAQLRAQVEQSIAFWLADRQDPDLVTLTLVQVEPNPDADHFLVTVASPPPEEDEVIDLARIQTRLARQRDDARRHVGAAIHRKRVPLISFAVIPHEVIETSSSS